MRPVVLLAAVSAVSVLPVASATAQVPTHDSVKGSGFAGAGFDRTGFEIDARSGPSGEAASGSVHIFQDIFDEEGPVTCLSVVGNVATLNFISSGIVWTVTATDAPTGDFLAFTGPIRPAGDCSPAAIGPNRPVTAGDLVVVDAPAVPSTRDHCKHGGWRTYGVFKNQGDCVSFVATGGKNAPATSP